jgi:hypothetical protein
VTVYALEPVSLPDGSFSPEWFDDERYLWDDGRLHRVAPIAVDWVSPQLILHRPERAATPVLFNPNAFAVSEDLRRKLARFEEIEFLPIELGVGTYYVVHVTASVEVPARAVVRRGEPHGGNIILVEAFPRQTEVAHAFFRFSQPADSAAGRAGFSVRSIFVNKVGAKAVAEVAGDYLQAVPIPDA